MAAREHTGKLRCPCRFMPVPGMCAKHRRKTMLPQTGDRSWVEDLYLENDGIEVEGAVVE